MNAIAIDHSAAIARPAQRDEHVHLFERELFEELRSCWKAAAKSKTITSASIAMWAMIRGANPKKGFSPIANPVKLANGAAPWAAYEEAIASCSGLSPAALAPWADLLARQGAVRKGWQWSGEHPLLALAAQARARAAA